MTTNTSDYLLGSDERELRRLEEQAAVLAPPTEKILRMAGLGAGMRVLDLGSGAGDVAFAAADIVGPDGSVVGVDKSADALNWARRRLQARRLTTVSFRECDLSEPDPNEFDAVIGRLILLYQPDPVAVLRRYVAGMEPGSLVVSMEYDIPAVRAVPITPALEKVRSWLLAAFERSGHDAALGVRLGRVLASAGIAEPEMLGLQTYVAPSDPAGVGMAVSIVRTLLPVIERIGIATAEEVDIETLGARMTAELEAQDAIMVPPTLVGAWGRKG